MIDNRDIMIERLKDLVKALTWARKVELDYENNFILLTYNGLNNDELERLYDVIDREDWIVNVEPLNKCTLVVSLANRSDYEKWTEKLFNEAHSKIHEEVEKIRKSELLRLAANEKE